MNSPTWTKLQEPEEIAKKGQAKSSASSEGFEGNLMECIGKGLSKFGERVPQLAIDNLRWTDHIGSEDIPKKPAEFERGLDKIFRSSSYKVKMAITEEIKSRFGLNQDYPTLKECFEAAYTASPLQIVP